MKLILSSMQMDGKLALKIEGATKAERRQIEDLEGMEIEVRAYIPEDLRIGGKVMPPTVFVDGVEFVPAYGYEEKGDGTTITEALKELDKPDGKIVETSLLTDSLIHAR